MSRKNKLLDGLEEVNKCRVDTAAVNRTLRGNLKPGSTSPSLLVIVIYWGDYDRSNSTDFEQSEKLYGNSNRDRPIQTMLRVIGTIKWTPGLNFHFSLSERV